MNRNPPQVRPDLKVCVGASAGGHTTELFALLAHSSWWPREVVAVTTLEILRPQFEQLGPTTVTGECDRHRPWAAVLVLIRAWKFVRRERPDVIVTTGSLPLAMVCAFVKLFRGRVVWVDSVAQSDDLSMSGRVVRTFADRTYSQWPSIAARHAGVIYAGELL